jgi:hypothetical protein
MKTLVAIILALGVGFATAYVIVAKQKNAQLEQLKAQAKVVAEPAPAPAPVEKVVVVTTPAAPAEESAQDILNDLLNVKLGEGSSRNAGLRIVICKMELLAQRGKLAVPAIRGFLARNVDVDYSQQVPASSTPAEANAGNNRGGFGGFSGGRSGARRARDLGTLQTDWVVPPSLRLGLVGTLREIGGAESEAALAEMLNTTGRGVEVAYLSVVLEGMAPGKYRGVAVDAAKELLMNPPAIDSPDRLDDLAKSYLYGVLEYFQDTSFAINAQQMLVGNDGRLDQDAMDYLTTVLKDQAVSALYAAYENPGLTNQMDKIRVGREVLNYVGQNSQANALFTETLSDPNIDSRVKAFTVMQLAGGDFGPVSSDVPTDPQVAANRLTLLSSLSPQFANDPTLSKVMPAVVDALQNNTPIPPTVLRDLFGGSRRPGGQSANSGAGGNQ